MYNFYNLNENKEIPSSNFDSISLSINEPLINNTFYTLFEQCSTAPSEQNEMQLGQHLNQIEYLIAIIPDEKLKNHQTSTILEIKQLDDLNFLICTTDDREVFMPVFTDSRELVKWYTEPTITLKVPAKWLWNFVLKQKNFNGIIFNPGTIGWDITIEHIQSLLDDINS